MKTIVWGADMARQIVEILKDFGVEAITQPDSGHTAVVVLNNFDTAKEKFPLRKWVLT